ncbi:MAG: hypothetical protein JNM83_06245 [Myxococcales bacterium]|nr:hypothetical protein [Myxococcales bacterium]
MDRKSFGKEPPTLDEELAGETPRFHEKLGFVFEIVQVVPLMVAPGPPPPPVVLTEMDNIELATKPPNRPPPGAVQTGSPIMPPFLGQLPPIKIEGHDITSLSVDMATHGFTGRMRFRVSETKLLGDVKDKDKVAKAFRSQNILMFKLCIRPEHSDLRGLAPLTPVMVPQVVTQIPVPVVVPVNESIPLELQLLQQLPAELALELQQQRTLIQQQLLVVQQQLLVNQQERMAIMQESHPPAGSVETPQNLQILAKQRQLDLAANAKKQQELIKQQQRYIEELSSLANPPNNSALLAALQNIAPPGVLPPKLDPVIAPIPAIVGTPTLLEPGISPNGPLVPIEMLLTGVITSHTVSEHTSYEASDIIVSFREYCIEFGDPAQALWKEHFPIALYTNSSVSDVIKKNANLLINIKVKSSQLSQTQDQIFLSLNKQNRQAERASFYDWLIWRLDQTDHTLSYDYSQNIYQVFERPKRPKPFQVFAADIAKIITTRPLGRFYQETLMNDSARIATTQPILNLLALSPLRQDRWFHTPTPLEFATEYAKRFASFKQPSPSFVLYFKRFPSRPFPPGVGIDFHLDPIDFPNHKFVIPKDAKKTNRVTRMQLQIETTESDVLPRFKGRSTGMFRCSLGVHLQSGRDAEPRLPTYTQPSYPMEVEGIVYTMIGMPGTQVWENQTDLLTGQQYYVIQLPVFGCQQVKTPFVPNQQPGQFFFPAYRKERVLVQLYYDRSELARYLDWRPMNTLPSQIQGNQLMLGQDFTNGAKHTLIYGGDVPEYIIQRQRYSSVQFIRFYQSGIEQKSVVLTPKVDLAIQRATLAASQALEIQCAGGAGAIAGGGGGGGGGSGGGAKAEAKSTTRARAKRVSGKVQAKTSVHATAAVAAVSTDFTHSKQIPKPLHRTPSKAMPLVQNVGAARTMMRHAEQAQAESMGVDVAVAERPRDAGPKDLPGRKSHSAGKHSHADRGAGKKPPPHKTKGRGGGGGGGGNREELPPAPRPGTPTEGHPEQPMNCRFGMDSGSGTALEMESPAGDAKHAVLIGKQGVTIETEVAGAKSIFEQHGDAISIRCREFTIDADNIRVRSQTHSSYQSLGHMTLSSLSNMTVQTPSSLNLTAMNGVTLNALTVLINALRTIRLLGLTGGIGTFAAGPGVHSFGAEISSTGLQNTMTGVTTNLHGATVKIGPPPMSSGPAASSGSDSESSAGSVANSSFDSKTEQGTDKASGSPASPQAPSNGDPETDSKQHAAEVFPFDPEHGFAGLGGRIHHRKHKHPHGHKHHHKRNHGDQHRPEEEHTQSTLPISPFDKPGGVPNSSVDPTDESVPTTAEGSAQPDHRAQHHESSGHSSESTSLGQTSEEPPSSDASMDSQDLKPKGPPSARNFVPSGQRDALTPMPPRPHEPPRPVRTDPQDPEQTPALKQTVSDSTSAVEQAAARIGASLFGPVDRDGPVARQKPGSLRALATEIAKIEAIVSACSSGPSSSSTISSAVKPPSARPSDQDATKGANQNPRAEYTSTKPPSQVAGSDHTSVRYSVRTPPEDGTNPLQEAPHHHGSSRIPGATPPAGHSNSHHRHSKAHHQHSKAHHQKAHKIAHDPKPQTAATDPQVSAPETAQAPTAPARSSENQVNAGLLQAAGSPSAALRPTESGDAGAGGNHDRGLLQRGASAQSPFEVFRRLISLFSHMTWDGQTPLGMLHTFQSAAAAAPRPLAEMHELLLAFQQKSDHAAWAPSVDSEVPPEQLLSSLQQYLEELGRNLPAHGAATPPAAASTASSSNPDRQPEDSEPKPTKPQQPQSTEVPGLQAAMVSDLLSSLQSDSLDERINRDPSLIPTVLQATLAAQAGALTPELGAPLLVLAESILESRTDVAVLLALMGTAAQAGLLPSEIAPHAIAGQQLAVQSNLDLAELRAQVTQADTPGSTRDTKPSDGTNTNQRYQPLIDLALAAADNGFLPRSSALTIAENPGSGLLRLPELLAVREVLQYAARIVAGKPLPEPPAGPLVQIRRNTLISMLRSSGTSFNEIRRPELLTDPATPVAPASPGLPEFDPLADPLVSSGSVSVGTPVMTQSSPSSSPSEGPLGSTDGDTPISGSASGAGAKASPDPGADAEQDPKEPFDGSGAPAAGQDSSLGTESTTPQASSAQNPQRTPPTSPQATGPSIPRDTSLNPGKTKSQTSARSPINDELAALEAVRQGVRSGTLSNGPELLRALLASVLSEDDAGFPPDLFEKNHHALEELLRADPKMARLLAIGGISATLGLLPPSLSELAKRVSKIAVQYSPSATELLHKAQKLELTSRKRPDSNQKTDTLGLPTSLPESESSDLESWLRITDQTEEPDSTLRLGGTENPPGLPQLPATDQRESSPPIDLDDDLELSEMDDDSADPSHSSDPSDELGADLKLADPSSIPALGAENQVYLTKLGIDLAQLRKALQLLRGLETERGLFLAQSPPVVEAKMKVIAELRSGLRSLTASTSQISSRQIHDFAPTILGASLVRHLGVLPPDITAPDLEEAQRIIFADEQTRSRLIDARLAADSEKLPQTLRPVALSLRRLWQKRTRDGSLVQEPGDSPSQQFTPEQGSSFANSFPESESDFWARLLRFLRLIATVASTLFAGPLHEALATDAEDTESVEDAEDESE